ncbi:SWI5-dependent HO expression protein 4 [[Candida] anglica]|uniref:SWI5-dependent HO expression protein 4 n=1 Tax=[Candida] anglica TaxID=148631 RepID=A0ABP0E8S8_9ASCO
MTQDISNISLDLSKLSIQDKKVYEICQSIFVRSNDHSEDKSEHLEEIAKWSMKIEGVNCLSEYITKDPSSFLNGLRVLNDRKGTLLIHMIQKNPPLKEKVLECLRKIIRDQQNDSEGAEFFLTIYVVVITELKYSYPKHLTSLLLCLGSDKLAPLVLMIIVKNMEFHSQETSEAVEEYFETSLEIDELKDTTQFLTFAKSLELIFPVLPSIASKFYVQETFHKSVMYQVGKVTTSPTPLKSNEKLITLNILRLVSSSCVNDGCRTYNAKNYLGVLKSGTKIDALDDDNFQRIRTLSTLCVIKIWNFIEAEKVNGPGDLAVTVNDMLDTLLAALSLKDMNILEESIEGLAYLTLNALARNRLRADETAIEKFFNLLKQQQIVEVSQEKSNIKGNKVNTSFTYGLVLILTNLSKFEDKNGSSDHKTKQFLKSFATPDSNTKSNQGKESQEEINLFNKSLLSNHKIIDCVSKIKVFKETKSGKDSQNSKFTHLIISIIYHISRNQDRNVRRELVQQGALNIALEYLISNSTILNGNTRPMNDNDIEVDIRLFAIRSIARMIVAIDPKLAFKKYDTQTSVPFLVELLGPDISQYGGLNSKKESDTYLYEKVTNLDKYESLLALTNLTSDVSNVELRRIIINKTFEKYLDNFIIDTDSSSIQRASWELISNLISEPILLAKFFNLEVTENKKRLEMLVRFIDSEDEQLQIVITGLIANATSEFEIVSHVFAREKQIASSFFQNVSSVLKNQFTNVELIKRVVFSLVSMAYALSDNNEDLKVMAQNQDLQRGLTFIISKSKDREVMGAILEILKIMRMQT